jgi:hypothetical protein
MNSRLNKTAKCYLPERMHKNRLLFRRGLVRHLQWRNTLTRLQDLKNNLIQPYHTEFAARTFFYGLGQLPLPNHSGYCISKINTTNTKLRPSYQTDVRQKALDHGRFFHYRPLTRSLEHTSIIVKSIAKVSWRRDATTALALNLCQVFCLRLAERISHRV